MKYLNLLLLSVFFVACSGPKTDYTILEGNISQSTSEKVKIVGADFEKEITIDSNGHFKDTLRINHDGFYEMYVEREMIGMYLEKGKNLSVSFDQSEIRESLSFSGDLGELNNFLLKKSDWSENRIDYPTLFQLDEQGFLAALEDDRKSLDSLYKANNLSKKYREILETEDRYYNATLIENYENAHGYYAQNPEFRASSSFYEKLKDINWKDTTEFRRNSTYRDLVETHWTRLASEKVAMSEPGYSVSYLKMIDKEFPNGYAKDKLMANHLQYWLAPTEQMEEAYTLYTNTNPGKENYDKITERYEILKKVLPGNISPSFNYENFKGGTTSLEDLKGKYVYIDVWATWCGPCLQEIPHLQQFEKDYEGKNLQVVSISIDQEKDYQKWRDMVENRNLGGLQLMADDNWKSEFVRSYGISGIPRFILVDPEGKIVAADAYRPSDPRLREQMDQLL